MNILADAHQRPAYQPRLLKHEFYEIAITEFVSIQADFFKAGTAKIKHLGGWSALQQGFYLRTGERFFEKIALVKLDFFLREELPRFAAGASAGPAIEVYFHGFISSFSIHT